MANHGPVGEPRNGWKWWILFLVLSICTLGIGGLIVMLIWEYRMLNEIKSFTQREDLLNPVIVILLNFIPYIGSIIVLIFFYKYTTALKETQQQMRMAEVDQVNPILVTLLNLLISIGMPLTQNNMNKTWEFAGRR